MKCGIDSDASMNDADTGSRSDAHFNSSARNDEIGENGTAVLGHELLILQDHDKKEDHCIDGCDKSKRLSLTREGENWLHIRATTSPQLQEHIDEKAVATATSTRFSQNSSREAEKREDRLPASPCERNIQKSNRPETAFEPIMQTQEPSPSQKTLTQTQNQTQIETQETETQQSMAISLLAYLNQPSQDDNEGAVVNVDIQSIIEILSGVDSSDLCSVLKLSPSSSQYPPNASAFLCFEELSTQGEFSSSYMTMKDMRLPQNPCNKSIVIEEERDMVAKIDLLRANRDVPIGWKRLPRRVLTVLYPGDRIRITITPSQAHQTAVYTDPKIGLLANITIILEYSHTKTSTKQAPMAEKKNLAVNDVLETDISIDMRCDGERQQPEYYDNISKKNTLHYGDKHLNTFVGTTRTGAATKMQHGRDRMPPRSISSNPTCFRNPFDNTESVIDSNASVAVDSTVNSQQESLRSSRIKLLDRNLVLGDNVQDETRTQNSNVAEGSSFRKKSDICDERVSNENNPATMKKDHENQMNDDSSDATILDSNNLGPEGMNTEKNPKVSYDNSQNEDNQEKKAENNPLDATTQDHNNLEPNGTNTKKNSNGQDRADDSSAATIPKYFTQETTDPSIDQNSNDELKSEDSSGATIPLYCTQEVDYTTADKNLSDEDEKEDGQTKKLPNHDTAREENLVGKLCKHPLEDDENIPLNIEIGDDDQEDGDRPPVSQLLLSMEIDNENEDGKEDENQLKCNIEEKIYSTATTQKLQIYKTNANSESNKVPVSNIEKKASLTNFTVTEKCQSEGIQQKTNNTPDMVSSVQHGVSESKGNVSNPGDAAHHGQNQVLNNADGNTAIDTEADRIEEDSDDETILGTDIITHNTVNSSITRETGIDILEHPNASQEGDDLSNVVGECSSSNAEEISQYGIDGTRRKVGYKAQESDSTAAFKTSHIKNQVERNVQKLAHATTHIEKEDNDRLCVRSQENLSSLIEKRDTNKDSVYDNEQADMSSNVVNRTIGEEIDPRTSKCSINQRPVLSNGVGKIREKWLMAIDRNSQEWAVETDDQLNKKTPHTTMNHESVSIYTTTNFNCARTTEELNSSDKEVTNPLCIKNGANEEPISVAASEEIVQPEMVLRSGGKRKMSALKSSENGVCNEKSDIHAMYTGRRNGTRSKRRSSISPKDATCNNQDVTEGATPCSFGPNKRSRTRMSKKDTSMNDSITATAANNLYEKIFNIAIEKNTINIVVSGFSQNEMVHITKLCRTKFLNVKKLKINETIDDNITACILPTALNDDEEASCRTLKAIRCALLGIPMVSLTWLERCKKERKVTIPTSYIRTLSTKIGSLTMRDHARYGVARLAAARCREPQKSPLPFQNTFVFLCGKYSSDKKNSITKLLEDGSANLITSSREASAKLESIMQLSNNLSLHPKRLVLLFGDRGRVIPKSLEREVMAALEDCKSRKIYVVDSNWVSFSIACARMLPPADFKPKDGVDLWRLSKELPE